MKLSKEQKEIRKLLKEAKAFLKKAKANAKSSKPVTRLSLPSNKRHKSKKDYKRTKVKKYEVEME